MPNPEKFGSIQQAKDYILAHPDESKMQQSVGSGFAERTIARARAELVHEGKLAPSRKKVAEPPARVEESTPVPAESPSPAIAPAPISGLLDHVAMQQLSDLIDQAASEDDDAIVRKRLLKQCLMFAFDTRLHPDTRMSASQMWSKLRDQAKAKELGPGKPMTKEAAIKRLADIMNAVGAEITLAAVNIVFTVQETDDATSMEAVDETSSPPAPVRPPESSNDDSQSTN